MPEPKGEGTGEKKGRQERAKLKMRFSELSVIIGIFVIDLALLYQFLRYDTNGTLLCIFIFLSFFALLELCFRRGINPMGLMPRAWGRPLCGLLAALLFYCAWSEEGLAKDALIALSIIMMVVMLIYPIFAVFSDSPVRRTPSSPSVFPANPGPAPKKRRGKAKRGKRS